jgi:hypothetical protein
LAFVSVQVFQTMSLRDKRKLSVSLCVFVRRFLYNTNGSFIKNEVSYYTPFAGSIDP